MPNVFSAALSVTPARSLRCVRRLRAASLLACVLIAGCSSVSLRPQPPEVQLEGISAAAIGPGGARARIRLAARNPNGYELSITSLDYMLSLDGRSVGGGTLVQPVTLAAQDTTPFDLDVRVDLRALGTVIDRATRRGTIPYELTGDLVLGDGTRLPFHRVGDFQPLAKVQDLGAAPR